jgi:hypothetical protein
VTVVPGQTLDTAIIESGINSILGIEGYILRREALLRWNDPELKHVGQF